MQVHGVEVEKFINLTWSISEAKLKATSEWSFDKEPRLSIAQAIAAARKHLQSIGRPSMLPVSSVTLKTPMQYKPGERVYFYFVTFDDWDHDKPYPEGVTV